MSESVVKMIINWLPFLILIGVWIFFMRRMGGGSTFQKDILSESKRSADASEEMAKQLSRIATALEQRQP
ncbi:hypothetical protein [Tabrizicola sp.]|uniref:hypothetical protein n=1 Tax=Tabrizicola sp. TaxID=2005166 RepID=UPI003F38C4D2